MLPRTWIALCALCCGGTRVLVALENPREGNPHEWNLQEGNPREGCPQEGNPLPEGCLQEENRQGHLREGKLQIKVLVLYLDLQTVQERIPLDERESPLTYELDVLGT